MRIFPKDRGEHEKYLNPPPLDLGWHHQNCKSSWWWQLLAGGSPKSLFGSKHRIDVSNERQYFVNYSDITPSSVQLSINQ